MTTETPHRTVVEGRNPSSFGSVRRARAMLNNGPNALGVLADDLRAALAEPSDVLVDRPSRLLYATDASLYEMEPVAVVFPALRLTQKRRSGSRERMEYRSFRAVGERVWPVRVSTMRLCLISPAI